MRLDENKLPAHTCAVKFMSHWQCGQRGQRGERREERGEEGVKEASLASCNFCIPCTQGGNHVQQEDVTSCRHGGEKEEGGREREKREREIERVEKREGEK